MVAVYKHRPTTLECVPFQWLTWQDLLSFHRTWLFIRLSNWNFHMKRRQLSFFRTKKKSPFVYVIYFIAANCKHIQGPCWGKEANFCQRQTDLDNLFIINCVNSFFFIVNFLLGSMSLCSKISIENFLSVTQSYQALVSVIIFVFSTLSFQMHQGIFASWKYILSRIRLGLKFIGDRRLLPLGYNFIVQNIASLFL